MHFEKRIEIENLACAYEKLKMEQSNKDKENTYANNLFLEKKNQKEQYKL